MHTLHNASTAYYAGAALPFPLPVRNAPDMPREPKRPPPLKNFAAWRRKKGLNQEQLAERLEIDQGTLSRWETGKVEMTLANAHAYAEALGIDPEDLWRHPDSQISELIVLDRRMDAKTRARIVRIVKAALDAA